MKITSTKTVTSYTLELTPVEFDAILTAVGCEVANWEKLANGQCTAAQRLRALRDHMKTHRGHDS